MEDLRGAAAEVDVDAIHLGEVPLVEPEAGDGDEEVEDAGRAVACAVDEHESAGAGAGEWALGDPGDERRPDGRVDGVSSGGEHVRARLCGQRVPGCDCPSHAGRVSGPHCRRHGRSGAVPGTVPGTLRIRDTSRAWHQTPPLMTCARDCPWHMSRRGGEGPRQPPWRAALCEGPQSGPGGRVDAASGPHLSLCPRCSLERVTPPAQWDRAPTPCHGSAVVAVTFPHVHRGDPDPRAKRHRQGRASPDTGPAAHRSLRQKYARGESRNGLPLRQRRPRAVLDEGHFHPALDRILGKGGKILRILDMAP